MLTKTPLDILLSKGIRQSNGCLIWPYAKDRQGYGKIWYQKKVRMVHRVVAFLAYDLPLDERRRRALHICNNPSCFCPYHLRIGTQSSNIIQAIRESRKTDHLYKSRDRSGRYVKE